MVDGTPSSETVGALTDIFQGYKKSPGFSPHYSGKNYTQAIDDGGEESVAAIFNAEADRLESEGEANYA